MGQCHSVALQVGTGTGGLVRDSCRGHWLQRMGRHPSTELKGVKALWELLSPAGWTQPPHLGPGKMLSLLVGFFQSWNGTERREGLVRFQVPTRVSKLREWGVLRTCQVKVDWADLNFINASVARTSCLSPPGNLDPKDILRAPSPRGPHQPGL